MTTVELPAVGRRSRPRTRVGARALSRALFAHICEVDARRVSTNVCDGLRRLAGGAPPAATVGASRVEVELSPIAHRFNRGHRVGVQISSGAHPRLARNPGTGTSLDSADAELLAADQQVFHDPLRPSAVVLPVLAGTSWLC